MKQLHLTRVLAFALALVLLLGCTACGKKTADDTGDTVGQKDTQTTVELDGKFTLNYSASAGMNPSRSSPMPLRPSPGCSPSGAATMGRPGPSPSIPTAPSMTGTSSTRRTRPTPSRLPRRRPCIPAA